MNRIMQTILAKNVRWTWLAWLCLLFVFPVVNSAQRAEKARVLGLMELENRGVSIVFGQEDELSAQILFDTLRIHFRSVKLVSAATSKPPDDALVFYVGSFDSNPLSKQVLETYKFSIRWGSAGEGSFILKTFRSQGNTTVFIAGKDRIGTLYATHELKKYYFVFEPSRSFLMELNLVERPTLKYRWVSTVQSYKNVFEARKSGLPPEKYAGKSTKALVSNSDNSLQPVKDLLDFLSQHKLNGLILRGRNGESKGAIAISQDVCSYAQERGVRILLAVGLGGSGGTVYGSEDSQGISAWTKLHPDLRAQDENGRYVDNVLCPAKSENQRWIREGLARLYKNYRIGGINIELDKSFVCYSEDCKKARKSMPGNDPEHFKDMARIVSFMASEARSLDPETIVTFRTYGGFDLESIQNQFSNPQKTETRGTSYPPEIVRTIPEFAVYQWDLQPMLKNGLWPSSFKAPAKHNIGLVFGGESSPEAHQEVYWKRLVEITREASPSNLEGLILDGNSSLDLLNLELNFLFFSEYSYNRDLDPNELFRFKVARMYGGEKAARLLMNILDLIETPQGMVSSSLDEALSVAQRGLEISEPEGKDRWTKFIKFLESLKAST